MKKIGKLVLLPVVGSSILVVSSCKNIEVNEDLDTKDSKTQEYHLPFIFDKYIKQTGLIKNEEDLDFLLSRVELWEPLSENYTHEYRKAKSSKDLNVNKFKAFIKKRFSNQFFKDNELVYFQKNELYYWWGDIVNVTHSFIDSVEIEDDKTQKNLPNKQINWNYVSLDKVFWELGEPYPKIDAIDNSPKRATLVLAVVPRSNWYKPEINIHEIDTLDKFKKFKNDVEWRTYTKPLTRIVKWR